MTRFTPKFIEVLRNSVDGWQRDNNPLKVSSKTEYDYDGFIGDLGEALDEIESLQSQLAEAKARLAGYEAKSVVIKFMNEDELPGFINDDVYDAMFNCSHVDFVRLFPYIEENGEKYFLILPEAPKEEE